jgi:hypothetical protein
MSAEGNWSQDPARKELSEPAHMASWQWDECQAELGLIQEGYLMGRKRQIFLPREELSAPYRAPLCLVGPRYTTMFRDSR